VGFINRMIGKIAGRIMDRYARKSEGKTIDLIMDHELPNVTPEMLDWWWDHIDTTARYKLWHPKDHKSFRWVTAPDHPHVGKIQEVIETIKGIPTLLRIRWEEPAKNLIPTSYDHILFASILNRKEESIAGLVHEYQSISTGIRVRSTFRLPAKTPQWFLRGLSKHNLEEMAQFSEFLPDLFPQISK
jgi:DAPG hydrolase PhiG domain